MGETNWKEGAVVLLVILAIGGVAFAVMSSMANAETSGIDYIVELQDGLIIQSSATVTHNTTDGCILDWCPTPYEPSVKAGEIVTSNDGTHCWVVTDFGSTFHYKILEGCPDGV